MAHLAGVEFVRFPAFEKSAAGRAAKAFVDGLIRAGDEVIISTTKPDKYDRYLADVFVRQSRADSSESRDRTSVSGLSTLSSGLSSPDSQLGAAPTFLNNALLECIFDLQDSRQRQLPFGGSAMELIEDCGRQRLCLKILWTLG